MGARCTRATVRVADFDFDLPEAQIAQAPADRRDAARLARVARTGPVEHGTIQDLLRWVPDGALMIVNDARVLAARLHATKPTGGVVEILLLEPEPPPAAADVPAGHESWRCLAQGTIHPGMALTLILPTGRPAPSAPPPSVIFLGRLDDRTARVAIGAPSATLPALLDTWGELPLPPYIRRPAGATAADATRYQTVFAATPGAVAAPTAGLHFTPELLAGLAARGIERAHVTLHVGLGTFSPVRVDDLDDHVMHEERFDVPAATAAAHARALADGRPIVAVGTTTVRALEGAWDPAARALRVGPGATRLFLRPGSRVHTFDWLLTNFHLPKSTLLVLVAAIAGRARILDAYAACVRAGYRFFSYGDAMLLEATRT